MVASSPVIATVKIGDKIETVCIGCVQKGPNPPPSSSIGAQVITPPLNFKRKMIYWYTSGNDNK